MIKWLGKTNYTTNNEKHPWIQEGKMKTLRDVRIGESARVVKVHGQGNIRRRVMDMGITKNVEIFVRKVAPLGDPIEVNLRGYELSLRKADAEIVEVI